MRGLRLALIAAALPLSSAAHSQDSGLVDGRVGPGRPMEPGPRTGFAGAVTPSQVVPETVPVLPRQDGSGTAWVDGHQVIVAPNSNRISRVLR
jgi:hypothetical protein